MQGKWQSFVYNFKFVGGVSSSSLYFLSYLNTQILSVLLGFADRTANESHEEQRKNGGGNH